MRKTFLSRGVQLMREGVKRGCKGVISASFRSRSYPLFGVPSGLATGSIKTQERYPSYSPKFHPPKTIESRLFWRYREAIEGKISYESGSVFTLPCATATSLGGNLTSKGRLVTTFLRPVDGKPYHHHDLFRFSTKRFFPKVYHTQKPVITLTAGWQDAFYHWIIEVLPRLHLVEQQLEDHLIFVANKGFQKESLHLLGVPKEKIIDAHLYDAIMTPSLLVPSISTLPTKWGCRFLNERLTPKLKISSPKRLYISRRDADRRRVLNETDVYALLKKYDFEKVELSTYPLKKQMELFASASMVVGPHGAGFSHLLFCPPGTPVLEFFHPGYVNICYWHLSNIMEHPYYYLFGEGRHYPDFFDPHIDPDITVDLQKLEATLKLMIHDSNR